MALRAPRREWITVQTFPFFSILTAMPVSIDWYFDFVSPFSYICLHRLKELRTQVSVEVSYKPVLFAGLLKHWGQKGPAEIPEQHPFNPLQHLRLALACGSHPDAVKRIFDWVWMSGENASDPERFSVLCAALGVEEAKLGEAKDQLRVNTEEAAARGVFGVPSFVVDGEVFWGADSVDFVTAFLRDEAVLRNPEMRRADALPIGAARKA